MNLTKLAIDPIMSTDEGFWRLLDFMRGKAACRVYTHPNRLILATYSNSSIVTFSSWPIEIVPALQTSTSIGLQSKLSFTMDAIDVASLTSPAYAQRRNQERKNFNLFSCSKWPMTTNERLALQNDPVIFENKAKPNITRLSRFNTTYGGG